MAKLNAEKNDLEGQLTDAATKLAKEEEERAAIFQTKRGAEHEVTNIKRDLEDFELRVAKTEQEKAAKDHQIRVLNDEISHQDEIINKINKEKKLLQEMNQK